MKVNRSHEALPKAHSDPKEGVSFSRDSETYLSERFSQETLGQEYTGCENRKPHVSGMIWSGNTEPVWPRLPVTLLAQMGIWLRMRSLLCKSFRFTCSEMFRCKMIIRLHTLYCYLYSYYQLHASWEIH